MRLIRLFCGLFALLTVICVGGLKLVRVHSDQLSDWMVFAGGSKPYPADLYLASPNGEKLIQLTNTPNISEDILAYSNHHSSILVGNFVVYLYRAGTISHLNPYSGKTQHPVETGVSLFHVDFSWSPDGQWLLYSDDPNYREYGSIYVRSYTSHRPQELVLTAKCFDKHSKQIRQAKQPRWSPNGAWIYFTAVYCDGNSALYRIRPNGTGESFVVLNMVSKNYLWSNDAKWLFLGRYQDNQLAVYRVRPDGSQLAKLVEVGEFFNISMVTSTGWVYVQDGTSLQRVKLDGTALSTLAEGLVFGSSPLITANWMYFVGPLVAGRNQIYQLNLASLETRQLTSISANYELLTISPDGKWLYFNILGNFQGITVSYRMRTDGSQFKKLDLIYTPNFFWIPSPDKPWHPLSLALGAIGVLVGGFVIRKKV